MPQTSHLGTFRDLMQKRIRRILLVSSLYDSFIMEEDGGLAEQINSNYIDLNLSQSPKITRASTGEDALIKLRDGNFDMVITMKMLMDMDVVSFCSRAKQIRPDIPLVLLSYTSADLPRLISAHSRKFIDRVFVWTGNSYVLLAMIKIFEDLLNIDDDIAAANVRVVLMIEDSPQFYSALLPMLYLEIMTQAQAVMEDGINTTQRLFLMRARPKILLAENFETARELCEKYGGNLLAAISDVEFPCNGKIDAEAGFKFMRFLRDECPDAGRLLMSSEEKNRRRAATEGYNFISKNSHNLLSELHDFVFETLGFGDFVFRHPDGREICRARNLREMERAIESVPDESIMHHARQNHFSNWFMARCEFNLHAELAPKRAGDFTSREVRQILVNGIRDTIRGKQWGVIADFDVHDSLEENHFMRIGTGSMGGKARGVAFIAYLLRYAKFADDFPSVRIGIPRTVAIATSEFDWFIENNDLYDFYRAGHSDEEIRSAFLAGTLSPNLREKLRHYLKFAKNPFAVRSSSLLEDSYGQPMAGIYSTYMLPNSNPSDDVRLEKLERAVKLVYASTFFENPRNYLESVNVRIEEEKMGILIQEVVGAAHGEYFYPIISGVAHSYNYYPTGHMRTEDGVAYLALGLGKTVVEGGRALMFCPAYPESLPQLNNVEDYFNNTQKEFWALSLANMQIEALRDESSTLARLDLERAEKDGALDYVASVYVHEDHKIRDGLFGDGPRIVTFANVLKHDLFPLAGIVQRFLKLGADSIGGPVEIEFAADISDTPGKMAEFRFLQIRPMVVGREAAQVSLENVAPSDAFLLTDKALGNGVTEGVRDVVYVKPAAFNKLKTQKMAEDFGRINHTLFHAKIPYIAIGMGRWGTNEPSLGIPVRWSQICGAKLLVEVSRSDYRVDPSYGTHFMQNITSLNLGYFCMNGHNDGIDWEWLDAHTALEETEFVRHVRLAAPMTIKIDGRKRKGAALKGDRDENVQTET